MRDRNICLLSLLCVLLVPLVLAHAGALAGALAREPGARGYTDSKAVRFDLYRDYLIVARGSAGPLLGLNFLLDTGATPTILDRRVAQRLHLQELPGVLAGVNGRVQAGQTTVPSLQFGPIRKENLPVMVVDLSFFDRAVPVRIDAVIGLDVVGQGPFEIDYASSQIIFGTVPTLKNSLPLQMMAGLPMVSVELNHLSSHLVLDTGASSLLLFAPKTPSLSPERISAIQRSSNMMGEFERKQVVLASLRLGATEIRDPPAFLIQRQGDRTEDFDGLMSPALLGITKLAIDLQRGVVEFSR